MPVDLTDDLDLLRALSGLVWGARERECGRLREGSSWVVLEIVTVGIRESEFERRREICSFAVGNGGAIFGIGY